MFDGINFGASDYRYSAYSMVNSFHISHSDRKSQVSALKLFPTMKMNQNEKLQVVVVSMSIPCLLYLSTHNGFIGIWIALTIYMSLRTIASTWRMGAARGPWTFLWN
jgi:Na+-driven multidrug efflux pump